MSDLDTILSQFGPNAGFIREQLELYKLDPSLVSDTWVRFFQNLPLADSTTNGYQPYTNGHAQTTGSGGNVALQLEALKLISNYRARGYFRAKVNPLSQGIVPFPKLPELEPSAYPLLSRKGDATVLVDGLCARKEMRASEILPTLESVYCGSAGFEFMHLSSQTEREFLQSRIEAGAGRSFSPEEKRQMVEKLIVAEAFEGSLHKKYVGQKRFSLEGGETVIPMLSTMLNAGPALGLKETLIGMSHRGRLNVLANIVGKPLTDIFAEFEDRSVFAALGAGDVKYHLGYSSTYQPLSGDPLRVYLAPNPSHLEFINPVLEGIARAKQDNLYEDNRRAVLPVLIHGEAAFAGQGVVYETINFAGIHGYETGGTIHILVNNQIGFTATPDEARATAFASDLAKGAEIPVFHVNAEDVEASCWIMRLALEFRMTFGRDVIIDLYCYRKYGHNEGDDPSFTQPLMYNEIKAKKPISKIYLETLEAAGSYTTSAYDEFLTGYRGSFEAAQESGGKIIGEACPVHGLLRMDAKKTAVHLDTLKKIATTLVTLPEGFVPHPKLFKILEKRSHSLLDGEGLEWGFTEALAFGSLMLDGVNVRLSGQDCGRGTFSHRHSNLDHFERSESYMPLSPLSQEMGGGRFEVYNSSLSEAGVLGFEFGYSHAEENSLVIWEAQFGDFANGAQVIIDQFIASSEAKWNFLSGVTLLLPHGYEGQGPEHSSARLERYLQLCAEGNMSVCYPSNAAQIFHLMRRQGLSAIKRPLIVMSPKSLLRFPEASCHTTDLTEGKWNDLLVTRYGPSGAKKAAHTIFLAGKVFYDVDAALKKAGAKNVQVVRMEQLYPLPESEIKGILAAAAPSCVWVQEEPKNMGAWSFTNAAFQEQFGVQLRYIGRPEGASTAAGSGKRHAQEQKKIVDELLALVA